MRRAALRRFGRAGRGRQSQHRAESAGNLMSWNLFWSPCLRPAESYFGGTGLECRFSG